MNKSIMPSVLRRNMILRCTPLFLLRYAWLAFVMVVIICPTNVLFAGQGASRMLYTVPNSTFIENVSGDSDVTINDTSGSISTLQSLINNARSANPASIIIVHLSAGATYWVNNTNGGLVLGSQECLIGSGAVFEAV